MRPLVDPSVASPSTVCVACAPRADWITADSPSCQAYRVRRLMPQETMRWDAYQRLRARRFVADLGWHLPVDEEGRERDQYDLRLDSSIAVYGVYGVERTEKRVDEPQEAEETEVLLGGVRLFTLDTWQESMLANEFFHAGMLPETLLATLTRQYACQDLVEITRLCVQRGRWYPSAASAPFRFPCAVARDLVYAAVYQVAEQAARPFALALVTTGYARVMKRSQFVFQECLSHDPHVSSGYACVVIDLARTLASIREAGDAVRAERMLALCHTRFFSPDGSRPRNPKERRNQSDDPESGLFVE